MHHISGRFESGTLTAIAGSNGAGKSTLLKGIAGILSPDEGRITIEGEPKRIAYLPQATELQRDFPMSVLHMATTGYWHKTGSIGPITPAMKEQASEALAAVGLGGFEKRDLSSLSVGQFQRALFARLIVQDAPLMLLDEPFAAIDVDATEHLLGIIKRWHEEKRTVICVLHDFEQIRNYFPECLLLARECIAWGSSAKVLSPEYLVSSAVFPAGLNSSALCGESGMTQFLYPPLPFVGERAREEGYLKKKILSFKIPPLRRVAPPSPTRGEGIWRIMFMTLYAYAFQPFVDYGFMRRALAACMALAVGGTPLGVFLVLRRMALVGDAMSHAILPGVSLAFLFFGLSLKAMTLGGLLAGLLVACAAGVVTRLTPLKEDASFTGAYLISLALGVLIISMHGNSIDLMHVLFGNVLAVGNDSLLLVVSVATISLLTLAAMYRSLIVEWFDPAFLRAAGGNGAAMHQLFLGLVALNLVSAFQALGTLMALGVMVLPAIAARFWSRTIDGTIVCAIVFALLASFIGLLVSYHYGAPSGPAIVLTAGAFYVFSVLFGRYGSIAARFFRAGIMPVGFLPPSCYFVSYSAAAHAEKLKVVASFSILGDMVHQIAGDNIELKTLVGPDGDAHVYEPSPADAKAIAAADLVVVNGLGFEGWLSRLIESSGYKGPVVIASSGVGALAFKGDGMAQDPHAWQSLANGRIYVANIRDALMKADGAHAAQYRDNAARYLRQLAELEEWVGHEIAKVPEAQRQVITSHDAFQYFAVAYGVHFIAPLGISTDSEASAADIARLIDQIRAQKIRAVFMENITDTRLIRQLESDGGAYVGGTLYSDALSRADGPAATYLAMFRHNVTQLVGGDGA